MARMRHFGAAAGPVEVPGYDFNLGTWFVTEGIDFIEALWTGNWTIFVQKLLDPFDLWFSWAFSGRPKVGKDSATDSCALFLIPSSNPVVALLGVGIRSLEARQIPISVSGGPGKTAYNNLFAAALQDLKLQFDNIPPPAISTAGFPLWPKGVAFNGQSAFNYYSSLTLNTHNPDSTPWAIYDRTQVDLIYDELVTRKYLDPKSGFPAKQPPPPPPPPPGKVPPPPAQPPTNPDETEVFHWYMEQYQWSMQNCICAIEQLIAAAPNQREVLDPIRTVLISISGNLIDVATAILNAGEGVAAKIDFTNLIKAVEDLVKASATANAITAGGVEKLTAALDRIAAAEEKEKPIDLAAVVNKLDEILKAQDVPKAVLDRMVAEGYLTPEMAQAVGGSYGVKVGAGVYKYSPVTWIDRFDRWWKGEKPPTYPAIKSFADSTRDTVADAFKLAFEDSKFLFTPVIDGILKAHDDEVSSLKNVAPCDEGRAARALLTEAIGAAVGAHLATMAAEALYPTKHLGVEKIVDIIAAIAGVEDLIGGLIGVEIQQLIAIPHRYCINAQGRTILPATGAAGDLHARGLITEASARQLLAWNGLSKQYETATLTAAYQGLNPRLFMRLFDTGLFSDEDIADELTFSGLRSASQHRMLLAAPYMATDPERKQLRATLEKAYVQGFFTDQMLSDQLDAAEHNTSRTFLILDRVRLEKRMALAKDLEAEYSTLYAGGLINLATYHADLVGLGLQDDMVRALTARYEARAAVTLTRGEAAAARALAKTTAAEERRVAMRNFLQGNINAAALATALVATGLTAIQAAAWVDMAELEIAGRPRFSFGMRLTPDRAQLLTDRVRALNDQRKRQLISDTQYADQLKALGLAPRFINALRAAADATLIPAKSATVLPVETK